MRAEQGLTTSHMIPGEEHVTRVRRSGPAQPPKMPLGEQAPPHLPSFPW